MATKITFKNKDNLPTPPDYVGTTEPISTLGKHLNICFSEVSKGGMKATCATTHRDGCLEGTSNRIINKPGSAGD